MKNRPTPMTEWTARGGRRDGRPLRNYDDEGRGGAAHEPLRIPPPTRGVDGFCGCNPPETGRNRFADLTRSLSNFILGSPVGAVSMRRLWKWLVLGLVVIVGLAFAGWY